MILWSHQCLDLFGNRRNNEKPRSSMNKTWPGSNLLCIQRGSRSVHSGEHTRVKVMRIMRTQDVCAHSVQRSIHGLHVVSHRAYWRHERAWGDNQPASSVKILRITRHVLHGCYTLAWVDAANWMETECASFLWYLRNWRWCYVTRWLTYNCVYKILSWAKSTFTFF